MAKTPTTTAEALEALAQVIATYGLAGRLVDEHVPDTYGNCRGCVQWQRPSVKWPCSIRGAANQVLVYRRPTDTPEAAAAAGWISGSSAGSKDRSGHLRAVPDVVDELGGSTPDPEG